MRSDAPPLRPATPWKQVLAPFTSSRTLRHVAGYALLTGLYAVLPALNEYTRFHALSDLPSQIHAALTLVLGWLLVFRTNTAYSRWWEARTLWGALVNCCRNLALKFARLLELPSTDRDALRGLITAFPYTLRDHLRGAASLEHLETVKAASTATYCASSTLNCRS
jgi:predicted membrane chloride channel (bestrophin family)